MDSKKCGNILKSIGKRRGDKKKNKKDFNKKRIRMKMREIEVEKTKRRVMELILKGLI